jgi:molybdate transport system ATP-binding protein
MSLVAHVAVRLGSLELDAVLDAGEGETVAILGPNGAGKTTLLRALAGLVPIDAGSVALDGVVLDDGGNVFVAPERRPIGVVFQEYLLFPHLSVLENVAFGLRSHGTHRAAARNAAAVALERVGLAALAGSKPRELSGGQAQRVALARATATEPRLLLLDEPLAALDQSARGTTRRELRAHLASFPGVRLLVTHDPLDAAALADRLVILEHGQVVQTGSFADVSAQPRSNYVAELVGVNLLRGVARDDHIELPSGATVVATGIGSGAALAVIHPRSISLHREQPTGSPRNVSAGQVDSIELLGDRVRVRVAGPVPLIAEITTAARHDLDLREGTAVWTSFKATDVTVFPV